MIIASWSEISAQISATTNTTYQAKKIVAIGGGCINETFKISDGNTHYFVKLNSAGNLPMFEAEAAGLNEIYQTQTLRVPQPICWGENICHSWLVLDYMQLSNTSKGNAAALGSGLAAMHQVRAKHFGWTRNNTIGSTSQINTTTTDWVQFWRKNRLGYQLNLAKNNGYSGKLQQLGERLMSDLSIFFNNTSPSASLLHGDLWSGNVSFDANGQPVIYNPAVYYGDREADIAMTELFGMLPNAFYTAYQDDYPLDSGYNTRKVLYNLYHILNHLNLFGGGYRHQAEQMMNELLVEIR